MKRALVAAALAACGHGSAKPDQHWRVVGFVEDQEHPAALLASGRELAVVDPEAHVRWRATLRDEESAQSADAVHGVVLVREGLAMRALSASDGRELWKHALGSPVKRLRHGATTVAVIRGDGFQLLDLQTGRVRYAQQHPPDDAYYDRGRFFGKNYEGLWALDEVTGSLLWDHRIPRNQGVDWSSSKVEKVFFQQDTVIAAPQEGMEDMWLDGLDFIKDEPPKVVEYDLVTGQPVTRTTWTPHRGKRVLRIGIAADGTRLYLVHDGDQYVIAARDAADCVRWSVPAYEAASNSMLVLDADTQRIVVDLVGAERHIFTIVLDSGASAVSPALDVRDQFTGIAGTCVLLLGTSTARCIDIHTAALRWSMPVAEGATLRPLGDGASLLTEGNPTTLSRISDAGRRMWKASVPGAGTLSGYRDLNDPDSGFLVADDPQEHVTRWQSDDMAVIVDDETVRVLDLRTGAIARAKL